ncbi:hypothetical protein BEWA_036400 [Theileria equi strain WA]|uniref:Uncharacterized protein n=1 Tax=Theileria equi strain WA TaxID=1537102 RepID=L1LE92_THEEQ|nr:hypothetical protein BEWA_036400 [Theileria equi strain WA]EKX73604.1 hypothetical protein BEWA_036400 [Theileria equi strain WA]|eukprot:XP_004833056.1 hypothetical protein BEWA_036400 [Theileria equi strain WA]
MPTRVTVTPSRFVGGVNYSVKRSSKYSHVIGKVSDTGRLITMGDPLAVTRYVLVISRPDNSKYVRVMSRRKCLYGYDNIVEEYMKRPGEEAYKKISRLPVPIDILTEESDILVKVELVVDWGTQNVNPETGMPVNLETLPMKFTIQEEMQDLVVLGDIKYNGLPLDNNTDGLIQRNVLWEGGLARPRVHVFSRYDDGTETEVHYKIICGRFEATGFKRRLIQLYE